MDALGNRRYFHYDALNRLTHESIPLGPDDSLPAEWWTAPAVVLSKTAYNSHGEIATMTRYNATASGVESSTSSLAYDDFGRISAETDAAGITFQHRYNAADYRIQTIFPAVAGSGSNQTTSILYLRSPYNTS